MQTVILAGGLGTRLSEETVLKPKPMVEIGGKPIIWHIMKIYSHYGFNDFIICLGYKGYIVKEYFINYLYHQSDIEIDIKNNKIKIFKNDSEEWKIKLIDTGENTLTGGRLKRIKDYLEEENFMATYGDGVADINISELLNFHKTHKKFATITAVQPAGRFGALELDESKVISFQEKPKTLEGLINGGFFVLNKNIFDYIDGDASIWERKPLETLASDNQLMAYKHYGFWKPMDTLRDKIELENLWKENKAPWKIWK